MTQKEDAERETLLADHIELNMSNYNEDDVASLNDWAILAHEFIAALDASAEPVAWITEDQLAGLKNGIATPAFSKRGEFETVALFTRPAASKHQTTGE